jgi:hypothetical protein
VKRIRLILRDPGLEGMIENDLELSIGPLANIVNVIRNVDKIVLENGSFLLRDVKARFT